MRKTVSWLAALTVLLVGFMATTADAQVAWEITPDSYDFGCVAVGETVSLDITVSNTGSVPIGFLLSSISTDEGFSSGFSNTVGLALNASATFSIQYTALSTGQVSGTLKIEFLSANENDPNVTDSTIVTVPLSATCGSSDPAQLACDILDYFDASVADGSIGGGGYCWWGGVHAMRYKLSAIKYFVANGHEQYACYMTWCAILKSDGHPWPHDWVTGPGVQSLNDQLVMLKQLLNE